MMGDVFSVEQRARFTALFSSVWGLASIAGPAVGGVITDVVSWRWVFLINIPICAAAVIMLWRVFPEQVERRKHQLDFLGAGLLTLAITVLLLATTSRQGTELNGPQALGMVGVAALLLVAFVYVERRAVEPVLPLELLRLRPITTTAAVVLLVGGLLFATMTYVPLLVQGVYGSTAAGAGAMLIPQSVGWPVGSWLGGRLILRFGFRPTLLLGLSAVVAGSVPFVLVSEEVPLFWIATFLMVQGFGLGLTTLAGTIAAQSAVEWRQRGVATSIVMLARSLGAGAAVTILGSILASEFTRIAGGLDLGRAAVREAAALLDPAVRTSIDPSTLLVLQSALAAALGPVFWGIAILSVVAFLVGLSFPRLRVDQAVRGAAQPESSHSVEPALTEA
jgi:MFS family permease